MKSRKSQTIQTKTYLKLLKNSDLLSAMITDTTSALPEEVIDFLRSLKKLSGIPFQYLVPDEAMLPAESLRFFQVDQAWLTCLIEGAASIGRTTSLDLNLDKLFQQNIYSELGLFSQPMTGFLLRSFVISGFPGIGVIARDSSETPLEQLRLELIAPDVLMGIYNGTISKLYLPEAIETLYFGVEPSKTKELKYLIPHNSKQPGVPTGINFDTKPYERSNGVVDISNLVEAMKATLKAHDIPIGNFTSAEFALEMTKGVQQVCFSIQ